MALNVELLQKVKAHILEEPKRFVMGRWVIRQEAGKIVELSEDDVQRKRPMPPCGTMACIAGWTVLLGNGNPSWDIPGQAAHFLGLQKDAEGYVPIFHLSKWSKHFQRLWKSTRSPKKHAQIAARVIDQLIRKEAKR